MAQLSNGDLLRGYYELRGRAQELGVDEAQLGRMSNQYSTSARIDQAFGARQSATNNYGNAIAMGIFAIMAKAQRDAIITKAVEARVELELRGWTPTLGSTRTAPQQQQATQYIERASISKGVSPESGQSGHAPTGTATAAIAPAPTPMTLVVVTPASVAPAASRNASGLYCEGAICELQSK